MARVEEWRHGDEIVEVSLSGAGWNVTATMSAQRIRIKSGNGRAAFTMPVPGETVAEAIVAELRMLGRDSCLRDAIISIADSSE
jgi:hypothetical protein